ncbi:hypothetical protein K140096H11_22500 [Bacteroides intestinalis]|uniref:O-antigen ligase domain-containing protein n=1 Tax=Bacteroides intestinalis TaxID=329854 RepID=A0A6N2U6I0_9BACE|nr:hypothetical protein [Bacteroides intestinalis]
MYQNIYVRNLIVRYFFKLLLLLVLFFYFYPVEFTFLPILPGRIIQIIGFAFFLYDLFRQKSISKFLLQFYRYGILIFIIGIITTVLINGTNEFAPALRGVYMFLYSFAGYLIMKLMLKTTKHFTYYTLIEWMIFITIVQAIISFAFFFSPNLLAAYNDITVLDDIEKFNIENIIGFRLMGVGNVQYATAAVQYGVILWGLILLKKQKPNSFYSSPIIYNFVICLFCAAGILSGRTFFLILIVTFGYIFYLNGKDNIAISIKSVLSICGLLIILFAIVVGYLLVDRPEAIEWIFELFINLEKHGSLDSGSTTHLQTMYIFPDNIQTWLIGDGRIAGDERGFYKNTDVGYIRSLFYWGIIGSLIYFIVQYKCFKILKKCIDDMFVCKYMLFILVLYYIYNLKDFWYIAQFYTLFLMAALFIMRLEYTRKCSLSYY